MMIHLSRKAEALARRLAEAQSVSVEDAVLRALEASAAGGGPRAPDRRENTMAERRAKIDGIVREIAVMPVLDRRSPREIMDDLNGG